MKISIDTTPLEASLFKGSIFLNGVEQKEVVEFDTVEGYVIRYAKDPDGNLMIKDDSLVRETVEGAVTVIMGEPE